MDVRLAVAVVIAGSGCAAHAVGFVDASAGRVALVEPGGARQRLALSGDATALRQLDDFLVEIDGRRGLGRIGVSGWRVLEGPHGMPVWVGPVQRFGVQVGIQDLASGSLYWVDDAAARPLAEHLGEMVAAEGYVDGPHHVVVVHWIAL